MFSTISVSLAVEDIEKEGLLPNHTLDVQYEDTKCDDVHGLGKV